MQMRNTMEAKNVFMINEAVRITLSKVNTSGKYSNVISDS